MIVIDAADKEILEYVRCSPNTYFSKPKYVSERILFSGNVEPTITHSLVGENSLHFTLPLNSSNSLALGKGPNRYSSLGN